MTVRPLRFFALLCIAWLLPALAAAAPPVGRADSAEQDALRRGIELYRAGQTEEALSRLRGFVLRHTDSPLLPDAYLYLARIFLDSGRPADALLYLERIPAEKKVPEQRLLEGAARVATGEAELGLALLLPLEEESLAPTDRQLRLTTLAEGNAGLGRPLAALHFLHRALALPFAGVGEKEGLEQQAHYLLRDRLKDAELAEAAFMFAGTTIGEDARLQMALRAFSRGDFSQARQLAEAVVESEISFSFRQDALRLKERLSGSDWIERSIGVLLPLSGRFAAFGELVRRGMELALQVHGDHAVRLSFVDTGSEPEKAAEAVSTLVKEQRVMAIAGPLTGAAAAAAAVRAEQERVPLLTLSQKEGLAQAGTYIFRNCLTNRLQVRSLVRFAMEERGITDFGVLYPENKVGKEMAEMFTQEVGTQRGRVVAQQSYAEANTDFRVQVRRLQGRDPNVPDDEPTKKTGQPAPRSRSTLFQALFIPDEAERIGLIVPQLDFYGLHDVQLFGTSGWNSADLLRLAGSPLEGAIFVDGFFRYSPYPFVEEFVNLYFEKYGEEPSILEAQGFDVAGILLSLLADPRIRSRDDLREALSGLRDYPGVTGATTFNQAGDAEKILFILQVQNGNIVQIN